MWDNKRKRFDKSHEYMLTSPGTTIPLNNVHAKELSCRFPEVKESHFNQFLNIFHT